MRRLCLAQGLTAVAACNVPLTPCAPPVVEVHVSVQFIQAQPQQLDLLFVIDDGPASRDNESNVAAQIQPLLDLFVDPPCFSDTNQTPHRCDPTDPSDRRAYSPVPDIHVAVVSADLGTPGHDTPGCVAPHGDDGLLDPIRNGPAEMQHEPWRLAPPTYGRPVDCHDPDEFPAFITFHSGAVTADTTSTPQFIHDAQCNADLWAAGCAYGQPLEAAYRALVTHDASNSVGNTSPNAGFLRPDAHLAILVISPRDDRSVRDCNYAEGAPCDDATSVYAPDSTAWADADLGLRFDLSVAGSSNDPNWSLDRYVDPQRADRGFFGLKPGHPERLHFAAITGVPLPGDGNGTNWLSSDGVAINWDMLLGPPTGDANDFAHRNDSMAIASMSREGPVSMRQALRDPDCSQRVVPACRREGTVYDPTACTADVQYFATPARRLIEVARRFDLAPLCNGSPCHAGAVASLCGSNYDRALVQIVDAFESRLVGADQCFPFALATSIDTNGDVIVACTVREVEPPTVGCDPSVGRGDPMDASGTRSPQFETVNGEQRRVCEVQQAPVSATTGQPVGRGFFYDTTAGGDRCTRALDFTDHAMPVTDALVRFDCVKANGADAGAPMCDAP